MPAHKRSEESLRGVRNIIEDCLREGYYPPGMPSKGRGAHTEAALRISEKYGCPVDTAWKWIGALKTNNLSPDYTLFRPFQYAALTHDRKVYPAYRPDGVNKPEGDGVRIALIGDAHDAPDLPDKSRFLQMGRWVKDKGFGQVCQIGDFCTLDSLTRHAAPGTKKYSELPSFKQDLESLDEALNNFDLGLKGWVGQKIFTEGNHEARAYKFEDSNPQMAGHVSAALHDVFRSHGWRIIPYGEIYFCEGVGLTHHAINTMGKPYGGKTAGSRIGNDSTFSLIHGHTHVRGIQSASKIGPMGSVDVVSIGCSLPHGHVEDYAKLGPSGWWWGVASATLRGGCIEDLEFVSMLELNRVYGGNAS